MFDFDFDSSFMVRVDITLGVVSVGRIMWLALAFGLRRYLDFVVL